MKKSYETCELEILVCSGADCISLSGNGDGSFPGGVDEYENA